MEFGVRSRPGRFFDSMIRIIPLTIDLKISTLQTSNCFQTCHSSLVSCHCFPMSILTKTQVSAGGVTFRQRAGKVFIAIINVGPDGGRWQLPKGIIEEDEAAEAAALREVREEAGVEVTLLKLIDKVEYWYYSTEGGERIRFHKYVHFYLMRYKAGDISQHDAEVNEARWVEIGEALNLLAFKSEKKIVEQAQAMIKPIK